MVAPAYRVVTLWAQLTRDLLAIDNFLLQKLNISVTATEYIYSVRSTIKNDGGFDSLSPVFTDDIKPLKTH